MSLMGHHGAHLAGGVVPTDWTTTAALTQSSNSSGWLGYTLRQVIPASAFDPASQVRFLIVASTAESVVIGSAYFGRKGVGNYDFSATPVPVLFGGNPGVTIPAGGSIYTDPIDFAVTEVPHLMSMYFSGASALRTSTTATGWFPYYKNANDAAAVNATGYAGSAGDGWSWSIMRVEVR